MQIIDITGTVLTPGNHGNNCAGNGEHIDGKGNLIECCCDECDYYLECFPEYENMYKKGTRREGASK